MEHRRLTSTESFNLALYVRENKQAFQGMQQAQLIDRCSHHIGREVSLSSVRTAHEAAGIPMPKRAKIDKVKKGLQIAVIANAVAKLYRSCGEEIPADLASILGDV
jgi:hypothetical protein